MSDSGPKSDSTGSQQSPPTSMRAIIVPPTSSFANPARPGDLILNSLFPTPVPTADQCLIRVHATGISRYELDWQGEYESDGIPRIPCFDVAGTVISSPESCNFQPGDKVFGLLPWGGQGGMAEYAVSEPQYLARIPGWNDPSLRRFPFEYAAVLPRAALTAWQALKVELGGVVKPGMNVLVTGAAGAVGRFGIQIARDLVGPKHEGQGAKVIAYGWKGDSDEPFADVHIERTPKPEDWKNQVSKVAAIDVIFDNVGGEVLETSLNLVKDDGIIITIGTPIPDFNKLRELGILRGGVKCHFFIVKENGDQLREIADMVQKGTLKPEIGAIADEMTEQSVRSAWESYDDRTRHLKGGVVVKVYNTPGASKA